ncbi:beta/gamma crystallin-related protein [Aquimarina sp. 2201CG1-2-11]|uniref:beta/gamma crystallin-related protein n=1 Tax=Aquimarina discodermiae TaxID=3231043 RepID=UPI003461E15A
MKKSVLKLNAFLLLSILTVVSSCEKNDEILTEDETTIEVQAKNYRSDPDSEYEHGYGGGGSGNSGGSSDNSKNDPFIVNLFNSYIELYEHDNFKGKRLFITHSNHLHDFNSVKFNDKVSSIKIKKEFFNVADAHFYVGRNHTGITLETIVGPTYDVGSNPQFLSIYNTATNGDIEVPRLREINFECFIFCNDWNDAMSSVRIFRN